MTERLYRSLPPHDDRDAMALEELANAHEIDRQLAIGANEQRRCRQLAERNSGLVTRERLDAAAIMGAQLLASKVLHSDVELSWREHGLMFDILRRHTTAPTRPQLCWLVILAEKAGIAAQLEAQRVAVEESLRGDIE